MASVAQSMPEPSRSIAWFREFLRDELAPYPGRAALAARMVTAVTIVMLITMTFHVPYGAYAALYSLNISRESAQVTVKSAKTIVAAFALGGAYVLIGAQFFVGDPLPRFFWVIASLFASFFAISVMTNYGAATRFGYLIVITVPLWDMHTSNELKVENTLWAVWAIAIATGVTVMCELLFAAIRPANDFLRSIAEQLTAVEELLNCYSSGWPVDKATESTLTRLATLGTSRLRRALHRSADTQQYREQMSALVSLVGRLVDIAANMMQFDIQVADDDRLRIRVLAANVAAIRADLLNGKTPVLAQPHSEGAAPKRVPLLRELETTLSQIPEVLSGSAPIGERASAPIPNDQRPRLFVADALSNLEHFQFGLKGCLAASLCYVVYNAIDWPGISTAVTTCLVTALTTVGGSRQKQLLRFAGAIVGGGVGMGAQIFILPYVDSIGGFTLLFMIVTFAAAWLATSGPRFSYFGIQFAVSFYLIHLQEFKLQTSLAVARDRVAGVLLGLFMMWLVFDRLWAAPAVVEMKRAFISGLRLLSRFLREPLPGDINFARERGPALRETINANFDKVRSLADGVLFEFGPSRQRNLALRDQIRQWQPQLRSLFVVRIALLKYRLRLHGFELPEPVLKAQLEFDNAIADWLESMADRMDGKASQIQTRLHDSFAPLEQTVRTSGSSGPRGLLPSQMETFLALSRSVENIAESLDKDVRAGESSGGLLSFTGDI
jgi:multidrug resistance protein MdtO